MEHRRYLKILFAVLVAFIAVNTLTSVAFSDSGHKHRHHGAHEHGAGKLQLILDGKKLDLVLTVPGADIVGFEYKAKSKEDKAKVEAAKDKLKDADSLVTVSSEGSCEFSEGKAEIKQDGAHNKWKISFHAECDTPSKVNELNVSAFLKAFPRIKRLKAEAVSDTKQFAGKISKKKSSVKLW